jgi:hypothetical protein
MGRLGTVSKLFLRCLTASPPEKHECEGSRFCHEACAGFVGEKR